MGGPGGHAAAGKPPGRRGVEGPPDVGAGGGGSRGHNQAPAVPARFPLPLRIHSKPTPPFRRGVFLCVLF